MLYRAYGHVVESDRELAELPVLEGGATPDFSLRWMEAVGAPHGLRWSVVWAASGGEPDVMFARHGFVRYVRVADRAVFRIAPGGAIEIGSDQADAGWLRHVLLDQVLPLTLASAGATILHASAVEIDGAAVLLVGAAGAGKSTLASGLAQLGFPVLADDGILLKEEAGRPIAVPSYQGLRLWPDAAAAVSRGAFSSTPMSAYSTKRRLIPSAPSSGCGPLPVAAVLSLIPGEGPPGFERLSRRDAALAFVQHAFLAEPDVPDALAAHLERACRWSTLAGVRTVRYRRNLDRLPELARAVIAHVRATASGRLLCP